MSHNAPLAPSSDAPIGMVMVGRTSYTVRRLPVGEHGARAGIRNNLALEGPRGSSFLVVDYGPRYNLNSVSVGNCAPRALRGLTRAHLAAFGVEMAK